MSSEEFDKFSKTLDYYSAILQKENEIEQVWGKMLMLHESEKNVALRIGEDFINKHPLPEKRIESYKYYLRYYYIQLYILEIKNDLSSFEKVATQALEHFCNLPYQYNPGKIGFLNNLIDVNLKLNRVEKAVEYIDLANDVIKKGKSNWFIYMHIKLKALLHIGEFTQAHETYAEMIDHRNFDAVQKKQA